MYTPQRCFFKPLHLSVYVGSALDYEAGPMTDSSSTGLSVQQLLCVLTGASAACGWRKSKGFTGDARREAILSVHP